jgi:hypothetical protein
MLNKKVSFFGFLMCFIFISSLYYADYLNDTDRRPVLKTKKSANKTILFYTIFWETNPKMRKPDTYTITHRKTHECPYVNCVFTHDKGYLKGLTKYDALVFHRGNFLNWEPPAARRPQQLYIMFDLEYLTEIEL